ncbi:unnamed protein product [Soboliphyme baturini]|uniref:E3 ubiquitin-protein transferase MAEA n=1 Tax=Soboliphyme baturini TaxID=241478 RepID=A0A183IP87_9BILA|nr:unnamed protein product [Soboliphyme baturini]
MSDITTLEYSTLKVPYEIVNKKFRVAQKTLDRETARVSDVVNEVDSVLKKPNVFVRDLNPVVDNLIEKIRNMKRKMSEVVADEVEVISILKHSVDHLKIGLNNDDSVALRKWRSIRIDRMLIDYFLRVGYYKTALKLAENDSLESLTNVSIFMRAREVEKSLLNHETTKCLEWCHDNRSKLRRLKSTLEIKVRQQEFIEMIRQGLCREALRYASRHFSHVDKDLWPDLLPVMGLLIYRENTKIEAYKSLFAPDRWVQLMKDFRVENARLYHLSKSSAFAACLQCGISSMKTAKCVQRQNSAEPKGFDESNLLKSREKDCPICCDEVRELAAPLPCAHATQSRLICAYSGEPLNENNPPMVLPNGMAYGHNSLMAIMAENNGRIVCPRTKDVYEFEQAKRVYVM